MEPMMAEHELLRDCRVLFGPHLNPSRRFLEYLQNSGVKSAYRKRALETHPDRVAGDSDLFRDVHQAYRNLLDYLAARQKGFRLPGFAPARDVRPVAPAAEPARQPPGNRSRCGFVDLDARYHGVLPGRSLRLGNFLYYCGLISWRTLIQALIWQRSSRPRLGDIGRSFGMLTQEEIAMVIRESRSGEKFGQVALRLGLLSGSQLNLVLFQQKRLEKNFGQFFVENGILSARQLDRILAMQVRHNSVFGAPTWQTGISR